MSASDVRDSGEPARLAEEVRAAAPTGRSGALVGIDGPGGSGKSTLADVLAAEIADAVVVHGDDFYRPSADRQRGTAASGGQFDLDRLLRQVVAPAASGGAVRYQWYDWSRDELAEWIPVPAGVTVIVEGVYCTELRLRDYYDYRIFCVADQAVRLRRGLERDGEAARSHWLDDWIPAEDRYIAGQRPDLAAQVVLASDGSDDDSAPVFRRVELSA
jgi:uridine kinase